ncbi:hypothetical protein CNR27_01465 [Luteimonas chenhongjianii]|uniref:Uncharacterized protein n=1 Tax=Luteimonas chenhongjianii TaxID=2006110 RepID=A0A290XB39_9GAMM|nr:hypothetical protein CNR27_01465 [Luteimonas chenhongjianii]
MVAALSARSAQVGTTVDVEPSAPMHAAVRGENVRSRISLLRIAATGQVPALLMLPVQRFFAVPLDGANVSGAAVRAMVRRLIEAEGGERFQARKRHRSGQARPSCFRRATARRSNSGSGCLQPAAVYAKPPGQPGG